MAIELTKQDRGAAIASLKQYFAQNLPESIGDLQSGLLLNFFLEEIGPLLYNQGVHDAAIRCSQRIEDLEGELHENAFTYWSKHKAKWR